MIGDNKIIVDEENHRITVKVQEEELAKAIGRRGQNARLTSRLMGWDVQVERDEIDARAIRRQRCRRRRRRWRRSSGSPTQSRKNSWVRDELDRAAAPMLEPADIADARSESDEEEAAAISRQGQGSPRAGGSLRRRGNSQPASAMKNYPIDEWPRNPAPRKPRARRTPRRPSRPSGTGGGAARRSRSIN